MIFLKLTKHIMIKISYLLWAVVIKTFSIIDA